jgi:hypothetical protein
MIRAPQMRSLTPRAYAEEDRANRTSLTEASDSTKPAAPPNFAVLYVTNRYRLPMHVAALIARLADIGRAL